MFTKERNSIKRKSIILLSSYMLSIALGQCDWKGNNIINFGNTCSAKPLSPNYRFPLDRSRIRYPELDSYYDTCKELLHDVVSSRIDVDKLNVISCNAGEKPFSILNILHYIFDIVFGRYEIDTELLESYRSELNYYINQIDEMVLNHNIKCVKVSDTLNRMASQTLKYCVSVGR